MSGKSLKSDYQKWLWMLATADLLVIALFLLPSAYAGGDLLKAANWKLLTTVLVPVAVLLLVNVLPHKVKCLLVYWKPYGWLPGCEVFSRYAPNDPRIDMAALARNIGKIPDSAADQNARWYQLFKLVENQPEVTEAHRTFLMYRDMAALSLPFIVLAPLCLFLSGAAPETWWIAGLIFLAQFILTAVSARWSGIRLVCNVVALHSARKISGSSPVQRQRRATIKG